MTKAWMTALACVGIVSGTPPAWAGTTYEPTVFVLDKLARNDLVFLGTTHRQPVILDFLMELVPLLQAAGVTHLALEITSDQQAALDAYVNGEAELAAIKLHTALECTGYRNLLRKIKSLPSGRRPQVKAIDLPENFYRLDLDRDQWMASRLIDIIQQAGQAKILVILGSVHVLRSLPWQARIHASHRSIRAFLAQTLPGLKAASIINVSTETEKQCDFARAYGGTGAGVGLDLDRSYDGWKLGPLQCMALRRSPVRELVEGVIVH